MGLNLSTLINLQAKGLLGPTRNRLLDIGPQNVYFVTEEKIRQFVATQGQAVSNKVLESEIKRLVYCSTPRTDQRMTFLSEITDLTNIEYASIDVCPGLKTDIIDLNYQRIPKKMLGVFDVVLNFGTTEHIFNQWNCFEAMHDAATVGGAIYSQLPATGYLDHGYFCYTPVFFRDLAEANRYEIVDLFFQFAGTNDLPVLDIDVRSEQAFGIAGSGEVDRGRQVPCFNVHSIMIKRSTAAFRCLLEIATAHAPVEPLVAFRYNKDPAILADNAQRYYASVLKQWLARSWPRAVPYVSRLRQKLSRRVAP
jgi:hypothetical protein